MPVLKIVALAAALLSTVQAHGYVSGIVVDGSYYGGWNPSYQYNPSQAPKVVGWSTTVTDNGYVAPDAYTTADIICHRDASPGNVSAAAHPGSKVDVQWNTWPSSHHGPVINYLANCNGPCESVEKTSLKWFKIEADGLVSGSNPGTWATDSLIANNFTASLTLPTDISPGNYVLRHEIIALHSAGQVNGAQNYPQCVNLKIDGSETVSPDGTLGTSLYTPTDAGIVFNLYESFTSYPMPGPALYSRISSLSSGPSPSAASSTLASHTTEAPLSTVITPIPTTLISLAHGPYRNSSAPSTHRPLPTSRRSKPATIALTAPSFVLPSETPKSLASPTVYPVALPSCTTDISAAPLATGQASCTTASGKPVPEGTTLEDALSWAQQLAAVGGVHKRQSHARRHPRYLSGM